MLSSIFGKSFAILVLQSIQFHFSACENVTADKMSMFVPKILPKVPDQYMRVFFNNLHLKFGSVLTPTQVKMEPRVHWLTEPGALYTVTLVDIDFADPWYPEGGEMLHWLVINIPGAENKDQEQWDIQTSAGEIVAEYVGACPPQDASGMHRYLLLAYKQTEKIKIYNSIYIKSRERAERLSFKITEFAEKYDLLGPIAGNFFVSESDDWALELEKQFKEEAIRADADD